MRKKVNIFVLAQIFIKRFILILLCGIVCATGTWLMFSTAIKDKYSSNVQFYVSNALISDSISDNYYSFNYTIKVVKSFVKMLSCNDFFQYVAENTDGDYTAGDISNMISISSVEKTGVINITVTSETPEKSYLTAIGASQSVISFLKDIEPNASVVAVDSPKMPTEPVGTGANKNTLIGFLLGMFICYIFFVVKYVTNDKLTRFDDFESEYDMTLLTLVPDYKTDNVRLSVWEDK